MLLVVFQLSCDVTGSEDSLFLLVCFDPSIVTVKQSFIVSQIVSCPVVLAFSRSLVLVLSRSLVLLDFVNKSFVRCR